MKAQKVGESPSGRSLADIAIRDYIGELYKVEREIKALREKREQANQTLTHDEVLRIRQEKSAPIAKAFRQWLDEMSPGVAPHSALGKAMGYSLSQWEKLVRYIEYPETWKAFHVSPCTKPLRGNREFGLSLRSLMH